MFLGATLLIPVTVGMWERVTRGTVRRIYGSEGQLGTRNTERSRLRTALTVAALMVGVAMILGIRSMTAAFSNDIRQWIEVYIGGDLFVYSSLPLEVDFGTRLATVPGVANATPIRFFDVKQVTRAGTEENLAFMAVDPNSYGKVTSFVFSANQGDPARLLARLAQGDGLFIGSAVSEKYNLKQGDTIRLRTHRGDHDFPILAVVVDFYNQGMVIEGSWRDMQRYFGLNDASSFLLGVAPGHTVEAVQAQIDNLYGKQRHLTVESNRALKTRALQLMSQAFALFDVLALIAMIVAALGVVNTMTMNVLERTQEIGMLRSLGMKRIQVVKMILAESGIMGLIGGIFGLGFGLFLSRLFLMALTLIQGYDLTYVMPVEGIVVSAILALIVSQLAGLWPARRAAGIRIIESIRFE